MLSLNGVSAWIEVDGKKLEQYGIEEDLDQRRVTCWIPTQVGKGFSVVFKDNLEWREHSLSSQVQIDGSIIPGWILYPSATSARRIAYQNDQPISATSSRPFLFSKLELTDEDEHSNEAASQYLGEIHMQIHRVEVQETRPYEYRQATPGHGKIHERSKKAVTQCISYGPEVKTKPCDTCIPRYLDDGTPLATFVFKYRDLGFLQAAGIAPRAPPTKKRSTASRDVLDLTIGADVKSESDDQEIKIIDNAAFPPGRSNVSRDSDTRPAKRIKREKKLIPAGEVIDLA